MRTTAQLLLTVHLPRPLPPFVLIDAFTGIPINKINNLKDLFGRKEPAYINIQYIKGIILILGHAEKKPD